MLRPFEQHEIVSATLHRHALAYLKLSAWNDDSMLSSLDDAHNGRYVKPEATGSQESALQTFSGWYKLQEIWHSKPCSSRRDAMRRTSTEIDFEQLATIVEWKSSNVDVYPTHGGWRVEKDGAALVSVNEKTLRVWKSLDACVSAMRRVGVKRINISMEGTAA